MKFQVGDIFVTERNKIILLAKLKDNLCYGYESGNTKLYPFGYFAGISTLVEAGKWKHYPVK